ncbi:HAD family hydrolase [Alicyclobacillus sp. SP_1]|uniref:HAD family hydrolase n=1 Tax=Alicyclobacillus sp. SP_1 TaxID=2942475 RepID=UPI0021571DF9|nr:HAD family hydrolase [Alicyclobacillus sp. SP_1]
MIFDLDDTLLNRHQAVDKMFSFILETCYGDVEHSTENKMLKLFKEYDKRDYGNSDKSRVFESLYDEFSPKQRIPKNYISDFWNSHFPNCFSADQSTLNIVNTIKVHAKVAIVTNGSIHRQKAKISNSNLGDCFDTIIISEEVGFWKPDNRIFELALNKLNVQPEETLFVGDDIEKDIGGCQKANIKGIWFNPYSNKNDTEIQPFAEINSLDKLLDYFR